MFDIPTLSILAGPRGLAPGDELTFFYPSTEWAMAQTFRCTCGSPACKGLIGGAKDMTPTQLAGVWLNGYIREMLEERDATRANGAAMLNGTYGRNGYGAKMNGAAVVSSAGGGNADAEVRAGRSGPTSRELSGEMGGDTTTA